MAPLLVSDAYSIARLHEFGAGRTRLSAKRQDIPLDGHIPIDMADLARLQQARNLANALLENFRGSGLTKQVPSRFCNIWHQTFISAKEGTRDYYLRAGYVHELCAVSENLSLKKDSPMMQRHPELSKAAKALRGQRDILTHRYGLPDPSIDWSLVWETFESDLENIILPPLNEAIEMESQGDK
jgi:hypothetical protein